MFWNRPKVSFKVAVSWLGQNITRLGSSFSFLAAATMQIRTRETGSKNGRCMHPDFGTAMVAEQEPVPLGACQGLAGEGARAAPHGQLLIPAISFSISAFRSAVRGRNGRRAGP